jgi:hypothetical protein
VSLSGDDNLLTESQCVRRYQLPNLSKYYNITINGDKILVTCEHYYLLFDNGNITTSYINFESYKGYFCNEYLFIQDFYYPFRDPRIQVYNLNGDLIGSSIKYNIIGGYKDKLLAVDVSIDPPILGFLHLDADNIKISPIELKVNKNLLNKLSVRGQFLLVDGEDYIYVYNLKKFGLFLTFLKEHKYADYYFNGVTLIGKNWGQKKVFYFIYNFL